MKTSTLRRKTCLPVLITVLALFSISSYAQNVGIGATSFTPTTGVMLDIHSAGTGPTYWGLRVSDNTGSPAHFVVRSDGNVGIGTMSPGDKLEVAGNMYLVSVRKHLSLKKICVSGSKSNNF